MRSKFLFALIIIFGGVAAFADHAKNFAASILTESDAKDILSGEVESSALNQTPDSEGAGTLTSRCEYVSKKNGKQVAQLDLMLRQWKSSDLARAQFASIRQIYRGQDVSGIGDSAFRSVTPAQLHVLKGRTWMTITAGSDASMEKQVAEVALRGVRE